jgi:hypothetical protein
MREEINARIERLEKSMELLLRAVADLAETNLYMMEQNRQVAVDLFNKWKKDE